MGPVAEQPALSFAGLLRQLRGEARLTQEELAEAAGLSPRSVSDLERGVNRTAHKDTALLLAGALGLPDPVRAVFVAAARGRAAAAEVLAARDGAAAGASAAAAATRTLPRDIASFTGRGAELRQLVGAVAGAAGAGGVVGIHAIGGMAGIGKTTLRGARRAPARAGVPGRAVLPAAACAHAGAAAGGPGRCAGQPAADRGGRGAADPAGAGGPGGTVAGLRGGQEDPAAAG